MLWSTPDAPVGYRFEVAGRTTHADVIAGYVEPLWNDFWLENGYRDESAEDFERALGEFHQDAAGRFEGLVRAVILLQEAQRRRPQVDRGDFEAFHRAFMAENGAVAEALRKRIGEERLTAHVERRWWLFQLERDFESELAAPPENELLDLYAKSLQRAAESGGAIEAAPAFSEARRPIEALWRRLRRDEAIEAWLDTVRPGIEATLWLPDGTEVPLRAG
ncbi:MAG TPA: hypothetical protein VGC54_11520 [Planctomycetota bacterium]